jgi:orotate phosphoribosyltransferase
MGSASVGASSVGSRTVTDTAAARARLLEIIKDKAIVHGRVTLSSGKEADHYVDLRRITLDGEAAPLVGVVMRDLVKDLDYDAVGGLTLGADPVATAILHSSAAAGDRKNAFVVRKAGKAHGLQQRIEGPSIEGRRVVIVEDTSTTGASPLDAANAAREVGAEVVAVATIADRATGAAEKFSEAGFEYRFVFGLEELGLA